MFSKSSVLFLEHICLLKWTIVLLAMVSFGKCFNIHKTLHVSLSIFLKRFSICDSVTTVLSSFFFLSQMVLFLECILTFSTFVLCCLKCQYTIRPSQSNYFPWEAEAREKGLDVCVLCNTFNSFQPYADSECLYLKHAIFPILNLFHPATSKLSTTVVIPSIYVWVHLILYNKTSNSIGWNKNKKTNPRLPRQANSDAQIFFVAFFSNGVLLKYPLTFSSKMATENHDLSSERQSLRESIPLYPNTCT